MTWTQGMESRSFFMRSVYRKSSHFVRIETKGRYLGGVFWECRAVNTCRAPAAINVGFGPLSAIGAQCHRKLARNTVTASASRNIAAMVASISRVRSSSRSRMLAVQRASD